jgi:hypothetical protein
MPEDGFPRQDWIIPPGARLLRLKRRDAEEVVPGGIIAPRRGHSTPLVKRDTLEPGRDDLWLEPQATSLVLEHPSDSKCQTAQEGEELEILNAQAAQKTLFVSLRPAMVASKSRSFVLNVAK